MNKRNIFKKKNKLKLNSFPKIHIDKSIKTTLFLNHQRHLKQIKGLKIKIGVHSKPKSLKSHSRANSLSQNNLKIWKKINEIKNSKSIKNYYWNKNTNKRDHFKEKYSNFQDKIKKENKKFFFKIKGIMNQEIIKNGKLKFF